MPSTVRSPTPANTERPPNSCATRRIISWMTTVLPTPAPPNMPIFPPLTYGARRSMTLMPVSNISVRGSSSSSGGAGRWIGQRSVISILSSSVSSGMPRVFQTWPSVASPTGTLIDAPVSRTSVPRTTLPGRLLRCGRFEHCRVDPRLDVARQQRVEHALRTRLELVLRLLLRRRLVAVLHDEWQHPLRRGLLRRHGVELGVDDVDLVDALVVAALGELFDQRVRYRLRVVIRRLLGEAGPVARDVTAAEAVVGQRLSPDEERHRLLPLLAQQPVERLARTQHVGAVAAGESAVARDEQHRRARRVVARCRP